MFHSFGFMIVPNCGLGKEGIISSGINETDSARWLKG